MSCLLNMLLLLLYFKGYIR